MNIERAIIIRDFLIERGVRKSVATNYAKENSEAYKSDVKKVIKKLKRM